MSNQQYPPEVRLRSKSDYERVLAHRCSVHGKHLIVYGAQNEVGFTRLGRIVGKRWGNAVTRNRYRRWMREAFRLNKDAFPLLDLVVMIAQEAGLSYSVIESEMITLANSLSGKLNRQS